MSTDEKFLLLRNYDLWCEMSDAEYEELNVAHHFIDAKKGDYIYSKKHVRIIEQQKLSNKNEIKIIK